MITSLFLNEHLAGSRSLALWRLTLLRLLILSFALIAFSFDYFVLSASLPSKLFLIIILCGFVYSGLTYVRLNKNKLITDLELFLHLFIDSLLLLALVAISGRTANPFIYYLLVLVAISSVLFEKRVSWSFSLFTIVLYTSLLYLDIKDHTSHMFNDFQLHLIGMWLNFVGSTLLITYFISKLATALRDREILLAQAREHNLKNEQLIGIGAIAASTVHALRTPLSTIAVLLSDLKSDRQDAEFVNDIDLLLKQVDRCKQTTNKLAALADIPENKNLYQKPSDLFEFLKEHYSLINPRIMPTFHLEIFDDTISLQKNILLDQAILNLIDNAIYAANSGVFVNFKNQNNYLLIEVEDDGQGIPAEIIENWGKPFFSKKEGGLGIGIFLANSTIERLGGKVSLNPKSALSDSKLGSHIDITIPLIKNLK